MKLIILKICLPKTKGFYQETVATPITVTKTTESKLQDKDIFPPDLVSKCLFGVAVIKDVKAIKNTQKFKPTKFDSQ